MFHKAPESVGIGGQVDTVWRTLRPGRSGREPWNSNPVPVH